MGSMGYATENLEFIQFLAFWRGAKKEKEETIPANVQGRETSIKKTLKTPRSNENHILKPRMEFLESNAQGSLV